MQAASNDSGVPADRPRRSDPARWADPVRGARALPLHEQYGARVSRRMKRAQCRLARVLALIAAAKHHRLKGCASVGEYAEVHFGVAQAEGARLAKAGRVFLDRPDVRAAFLDGAFSLDAVVALAAIHGMKEATDEGIDFVQVARKVSARDLRRIVDFHLEKWRSGRFPVHLELWLSPRGLEVFRRARVVAEARRKKPLSEGEALHEIAGDYVERHDPMLQDGRPANADEAGPEGSRYIPVAVRREVMARDGYRCAVPGCDAMSGLEFCHLRAHADGGPTSRSNLFLGCGAHNDLMRTGHLRVEGTADDPVFLDRDGRVHVPWLHAFGPAEQRPRFEEWLADAGLRERARAHGNDVARAGARQEWVREILRTSLGEDGVARRGAGSLEASPGANQRERNPTENGDAREHEPERDPLPQEGDPARGREDRHDQLNGGGTYGAEPRNRDVPEGVRESGCDAPRGDGADRAACGETRDLDRGADEQDARREERRPTEVPSGHGERVPYPARAQRVPAPGRARAQHRRSGPGGADVRARKGENDQAGEGDQDSFDREGIDPLSRPQRVREQRDLHGAEQQERARARRQRAIGPRERKRVRKKEDG
jgi:hypothetical protein